MTRAAAYPRLVWWLLYTLIVTGLRVWSVIHYIAVVHQWNPSAMRLLYVVGALAFAPLFAAFVWLLHRKRQ